MDKHLNRLLDLGRKIEIDDFYPGTYLYDLLEESEQIAKGGTATEIYQNENLVIKVTKPCSYIKEKPYRKIKEECQYYHSGNLISKVPQEDKILLTLPTSLSEGLIGGYLNKLKLYTNHFITIRDVAFSPNKSNSFLVSNYYNNDIGKVINKPADIVMLFFQLAQALSCAQEFYRFTHYDLHGGNIFYRLEENKPYPIVIDGKLVYFKLTNSRTWQEIDGRLENEKITTFKIADFGFSRMENPEMVVNGRMTNFGIDSWGFFTPWYDLLSTYGYFFWSEEDNELKIKIRNVIGKEVLQALTNCFLFDNEKLTYSQFMYQHFGENKNGRFWRPKTDKFNKIIYFNLPSIAEITGNLAKLLLRLNGGELVNTSQDSFHRLPSYLVSYPRRIAIQLDDNHPFKITETGVGKLYSFEKVSSIGIPPYVLTPTERMILNCPDNLQYCHILFVNTKDKNFVIDCCKIDMYNWIRNKFGLAINGGFFSLKGDFRPIGPYSQIRGETYWHSNLPIPKTYRPYYGLLYLDRSPKLYKGSIPLAGQYFASGPILIYNGKTIVDENLIEQTKNNVKYWQCAKPAEASTNKDKYIKNFEFYHNCGKIQNNDKFDYPNCEKIEPGELSHSANPNPRSMIIWRDNEDGLGDMALVVVEGRENRGDGMTLIQLADLAKSLKAYDALNLDGGRSSNMVWRTSEQPKVIMSVNPLQLDSYPVGDLLGIVDNI